MTSRPPLGIQSRQPQRSVSGSGLSQRPPNPQRSLSQQYLPQSQSPARRADSFTDQQQGPVDLGDSAGSRYVAPPRRVGSRLRLELANDGIEHAGFSESPKTLEPLSGSKVFTPSRMMHMNDTSELGDLSAPQSRCHTAEGEPVPLPMPPRRARFVVPAKRSASMPAPSTPSKRDGRPKPFHLETPAAAPRFPPVGKQEHSAGKSANGVDKKLISHADFYAWTGNNAEDQFSDHIIRNGFLDKAPGQAAQEASSAKVTLFPALKHKSGLHTLSTIFTSVLNQRRQSGQISAPSTFKPPPRVTVTDTKREVWLKELANPQISLRRLSRTIPHGIRGRVLLDQCLNKNVPTDRAVWLAKCVGANEIRAFKRKGVSGALVMGGEIKWIRDWTLCIEQFIDAVVGSFSDVDWKAKVQYAIRLATHLYAEHLLDRDHYMDWLVAGLENTTQARLPMWLLISQIYWKDMLRLRKYGRRLVTAIVGHYNSIFDHPDQDILAPLSTQLRTLISSLMLTTPENFVHPQTWTKGHDAIRACVMADEATIATFSDIDARNSWFISPSVKSQPAVRTRMVKLLDNILRAPMAEDTPKQLWDLGEDKAGLVRTVLEWATSLHRPGIAKVYAATTILRSWAVLDIDTTGSILEYINTNPLSETSRQHLLYHLVSELVRSNNFSVARYIQWLIARGGLTSPQETQTDGPCATRLLVEVPTNALSDSMKSLRATLLRRASYSVQEESQNVANAIGFVKHALSGSIDDDDDGSLVVRKPRSIKKLTRQLSMSSRALQSEVCAWLCKDFVGGVVEAQLEGTLGAGLPLSKFESIRALVEASNDFAMLEDILKMLSHSTNPDLLASCADTINLHLSVFAATGSAKMLFQLYYDRFRSAVDDIGVGARPLLASLASLGPRLPGFEDIAAQLKDSLARLDRSNAVDASSPLSDNMVTQLQDDEAELTEQIEKLASYSSADQPTLERVFQAIIFKLQSCWGKDDGRQRAYCMLLTRLRVFDQHHFDNQMRAWLQHIRKLSKRPQLTQMFPLLVSSGCLSLAILFATAPRNQSQGAQIQPSAVGCASIYMQEILQMLMMPLEPDQVLTSEDCYRFRIIQDQARLEHAKEIMSLIRGALAEYAAPRNPQAMIAQPLDDNKTKFQLLELLRILVLLDPLAACQTLSIKSSDANLRALIETLTTKLLVPQPSGSSQKSFEQVLELANEFTLPFCQVKVSLNLSSEESGTADSAERVQSQLEQLSRAMDNAISANNIMWTGMLPSLNAEMTQHLKNRAEARFLELFPSPKIGQSSGDTTTKEYIMAENLLTVIDAIVRGNSAVKGPAVTAALAEKLLDMWEIVATPNTELASLKDMVLAKWLPLLLAYLTMQTSTDLPAAELAKAPAGEMRGRVVLALAGIAQELDFQNHGAYVSLSQRVFDAALVIADTLSEEARLQCVRAVKDMTSDVRVRYLLSFSANPADTFMLAHRERPPPGLSERERRAMVLGMGLSGMLPERLSPFTFRRWEILSEPTPNVGENDTSLSLTLFDARKL
ncbi:transcription mediator subunit Med12 [Microdochium trichocladiopsis]|uniref:Mediator of RNA polymerase II transcription subunit 12 n=1 Tax=Microdochium trichocladiopsis TaxID=1682393 RepID=A0A9P9BS06_9PEZI|nr:transcription mediator subunit Med12 [Microdochium trichocladiopsis]KAH7037405.1 transcription mediator subunit Med12 [Microdochium trichocladiopsis]